MRVTIIPDDGAVYVDGVCRTVDLSWVDPGIHAVQWDGQAGEIERKRGAGNEAISDLGPFAQAVTLWNAAAPVPDTTITVAHVAAERNRRLALGFNYDFGDARGVHHIGTTAADMAGWAEVSTYAGALIDSGDTTSTITIATDTGVCQVTAPEWRAVEIASAAFRQPLWAASFALMAMTPIPQDYTHDSHWP